MQICCITQWVSGDPTSACLLSPELLSTSFLDSASFTAVLLLGIGGGSSGRGGALSSKPSSWNGSSSASYTEGCDGQQWTCKHLTPLTQPLGESGNRDLCTVVDTKRSQAYMVVATDKKRKASHGCTYVRDSGNMSLGAKQRL